MKDIRKTFIQILEIIDYKKDKEKFTNEFISLCIEQAYFDLTESMTPEKKDSLKKLAENAQTLEAFADSLNKHIDPNVLRITIETVSARLFQEYISTIMPTLSPERKMKLLDYLATLSTVSNKM
jgi:hypothetical protein